MAAFVMLGKYSTDALKGISAKRTEKAGTIVQQAGGTVTSMYTLLGGNDLLLIVDLPDIRSAMKVSVALGRETGIAFTTSPAIPVDEFDKMMD